MSPSRRSNGALCAIGLGLVFGAAIPAAIAQDASTPIRSPQDAACRNEARSQVFATPDPRGLGLYAIGRQIYVACMKRTQGGARRAGKSRRS